MKISSINKAPSIKHKPVSEKFNNSEQVYASCALVSPNYDKYGSYTYGINFGKIKNKEDIYAKTSEFSKYFHSKIEDKLIIYTSEDIDNMIASVCEKTGAKEDTTREVFVRLAQFSTNSDLNALEDSFDENNIYEIQGNNCRLSTNTLLQYIATIKEQFSFRKYSPNKKSAIILDDKMLDYYERIKNKNPDYLERFKRNFNRYRKEEFFIIDGWNAEVNGQKQIFTMLGQTGTIEDVATNIICEMQKTGKSADDILNKPILDRTKQIFGEDVKVGIIKSNEIGDTSSENIARMLTSIMPSVEEIHSSIDLFANGISKTLPFFEKSVRKTISKYLDNFLCSYSTFSMNDALIKKYNAVKKLAESLGKDEEDILYLIPDKAIKSFHLVSNQYSIANNIEGDKFISYNDVEDAYIPKVKNGSICVLLDDFIGSANSVITTQFDYKKWSEINPDTTIVFAPVCACSEGIKSIEIQRKRLKRDDKDFILPTEVVDNEKILSEKFSKTDDMVLKFVLGDLGFMQSMSCCVFPFSHPDNNTSFSDIFTLLFLRNDRMFSTGKWKYRTSPDEILKLIRENEHTLPSFL